jgi:hypothetical protein
MAIIARPMLIVNLVAAEDISLEYSPMAANGFVAAADGRALGLAQRKAPAGSIVPVAVLGTSVAIASSVIAIGDLVDVAASANAGTRRVKSHAAGVPIGIALTAANPFESLEILLLPN